MTKWIPNANMEPRLSNMLTDYDVSLAGFVRGVNRMGQENKKGDAWLTAYVNKILKSSPIEKVAMIREIMGDS